MLNLVINLIQSIIINVNFTLELIKMLTISNLFSIKFGQLWQHCHNVYYEKTQMLFPGFQLSHGNLLAG